MPASHKPYRYIRRIDNDHNLTHSWHVCIRRTNQDITKHFSDKRYGGKELALQAAIAFRDTTLKELDTGEYALWKRRLGRHSRNTSGITGVGRYVHKYKRKDGTVVKSANWSAFWKDRNGERQIRAFSVNTHGEEGARRLAIEARSKAMIAMFGQPDITTLEEAKKSEEKSLHIRETLKGAFAPSPSHRVGQVGRYSFRRYSKEAEAFIDYPYWRASWKDKHGNEKSCRFTVRRYGEEGALQRALETLKSVLGSSGHEDWKG